MGPHEQSIARQAVRLGNPIPDRIANAPELQLGLQLYWQAFFDLDSERSHGFTLTPIPWNAIAGYCIAHDLDEDQTEDMFYFVKAMDAANLKRLAKNNENG